MYATEEQTGPSAFREAEKKYQRHICQSFTRRSNGVKRGSKSKQLDTDLSSVLDFEDPSTWVQDVKQREGPDGQQIFTLFNRPGFYLIRSALTENQQLQLASDCLLAFTQPPSHTNHTRAHGEIAELWEAAEADLYLRGQEFPSSKSSLNGCKLAAASAGCRSKHEKLQETELDGVSASDDSIESKSAQARLCGESGNGSKPMSERWTRDNAGLPSAKRLLEKLRWACVGPNFDWSNRRYLHKEPHQRMPLYLRELAQRCTDAELLRTAGLPPLEANYKPEAALINYYKGGDTLGGHLDDVEEDMRKPIVSISLGCDAIFLLGGTTKSEPASALIVRSGDAIVLSGQSRQCYHGVPRILTERGAAKAFMLGGVERAGGSNCDVSTYMQDRRINISIRETL